MRPAFVTGIVTGDTPVPSDSVPSDSDKEINCKNRGRGSYWLSTLDL